MKNKRLLTISLLGFLGLTLGACDEQTPPIVEPIDPSISSIQHGFIKLAANHDFTLTVENTHTDASGKIYFTSTSYLNEVTGLGYINDKYNGVYRITINNEDELVPGELIKGENNSTISDIYDADLVSDFSLFDPSRFGVEENKSLSITDTTNRYAFLTLVGIDSGEITSITSLTASYSDDTINSLVMRMQFEDNTYVNVSLSSFGATSNLRFDSFLASGGSYYVPDNNFTRVRSLFSGHNYTRQVLDGNNQVAGLERFTNRYYAMTYYESTGLTIYNDAYFAADNQLTIVDEENNELQTLDLFGIYRAFINGNETDGYSISPILSFPYNSETIDIAETMKYPSNAILFDRFEYFDMVQDQEDLFDVPCYFTNDFEISYDLYQRFFLNYHESYETGLIGCGFNFDLVDGDALSYVTFYIFLTLNGTPYYQEFVFTEFNNTAFEPLDQLTTSWIYQTSTN